MYRLLWIAFLLCMLPTSQGCGSFDFLKSDTGDNPQAEMPESPPQNETERLRMENSSLQQQIAYTKKVSRKSLEECQETLEGTKTEQEALREEIAKLRQANYRMALENKALKEQSRKTVAGRTWALKREGQTSSRSNKPTPLKIKVLTGDGDLDTARQMTKKLMKLDYDIRHIGYAPRSDFKKNIIFFKPSSKKTGTRLLSELGGNTVMRPLTWSSMFDIIIVTGGKP